MCLRLRNSLGGVRIICSGMEILIVLFVPQVFVLVILWQRLVYFFIGVVVQDRKQRKAWFYNMNAVTCNCVSSFLVIVSLMKHVSAMFPQSVGYHSCVYKLMLFTYTCIVRMLLSRMLHLPQHNWGGGLLGKPWAFMVFAWVNPRMACFFRSKTKE